MNSKFILLILLLAGVLWFCLAHIVNTSPSEVPPAVRFQAPQSLPVGVASSVPSGGQPQHVAPPHQPLTSPMPENALNSSDTLPKFSQAQPVGNSGTPRWLTINDVASIPLAKYRSMAKPITSSSVKPRNINGREDAASHLNLNVAMALRPSVAFEDTDCYYFSGGTTAYPVNDFSCGVIVQKATGVISSWQSVK